jgi:MYXO-CTERM domain-containing protein
MGGLGGATKDYGMANVVGGGALVATGAVAAAWFLRRRSKPHRL